MDVVARTAEAYAQAQDGRRVQGCLQQSGAEGLCAGQFGLKCYGMRKLAVESQNMAPECLVGEQYGVINRHLEPRYHRCRMQQGQPSVLIQSKLREH